MIKSFLITASLSIFLFSSQQIVLVVANDMNSSSAKLECYEGSNRVFQTMRVNLGKNGLGWGVESEAFQKKPDEALKYEGDKKAPAGIFKLTDIFGYSPKGKYALPYLYADTNLICVDDTDANFYNQIIMANGDEKSFEYMRRKDNQYKLGIVVGYNKQARKGRGSCIFIHIQRAPNTPTVGCTSMSEKDIKKILNWLDKKKNPVLVQIPKKSAKEVLQLYPQLKNSKLLK
ncbi:L,D-transpeptidase family protein [Sulfurimonas sediminis]|uniref:L,D-transpeptidase family protein n=1 Tax=Sulfurimonas sediminis TaxID=2590020 RepID=A0A7M1B2B7_9BACT|nr:L,D-transpeptidase family protein [Sulfurimonas sediminis]QOP42858.1 L,D-transpeptidase family protein [Sulfurimonas sediminis]